MTENYPKKERLQHHFGDRPISWVPFWGISKLRRRRGIFAGEIPGDLIEYDKWYERMLSPATFDQLAEMGFNLAILPFSLGGTSEQEAREHEESQKLVIVFPEKRSGTYRSLDGETASFNTERLEIDNFRTYGIITFS